MLCLSTYQIYACLESVCLYVLCPVKTHCTEVYVELTLVLKYGRYTRTLMMASVCVMGVTGSVPLVLR